MKNKNSVNGKSSLPQHLVDLGDFTIELKNRIDQANLLSGKTGHKFAFRTGTFNLVLPENVPAEVISPPGLCMIPNTPEWFRGMINLRGNLLPVFDLDGLITGASPKPINWVIVFGNDESKASICIETLPSSVEFSNNLNLEDAEIPEILRSSIRNAYSKDNVIWLEPDYKELLSEFSRHF